LLFKGFSVLDIGNLCLKKSIPNYFQLYITAENKKCEDERTGLGVKWQSVNVRATEF